MHESGSGVVSDSATPEISNTFYCPVN